jgi:hypothetical protein
MRAAAQPHPAVASRSSPLSDAVLGTGRARGILARAAAFVPLSARGTWLALACATALQVLGLGERDLLVLVAAATGLGMIAIASLGVALGAVRVRAELGRARGAPAGKRLLLETGRESPTGFSLPRLRALWLVDVEVEWIEPAGARAALRARGGRLEERIRVERRFETGRVLRRISVVDALGLARCAWTHSSAQQVVALPSTRTLRLGSPPAASSAGESDVLERGRPEGDRLETRPHQPGEPSRHILWRSWARSRQLFARAPERSASLSRRVAAYLICGPGDEPAAGAARGALEAGALGSEWLLGADGCTGAAARLDDALVLIARSGDARGATRIAAFAERAWRDGETGLLVFAPAQAGPWVDALEQLARARKGACAVVIALDAERGGPGPRVRWLRRRRPDPDDLETLRTRLGAVARVAVVPRSAGASGAAAALAQLGSRA